MTTKKFNRVQPNSVLFDGIVPPDNVLFGGTLPPNSVLFGGTVPANSFFLFFNVWTGPHYKEVNKY